MIGKKDGRMKNLFLMGLLVIGLLLSSCEIAVLEEGEGKGETHAKSSDEFSEVSYRAKVVKVDFYYDMIFRALYYKAIIELENTGFKNIEVQKPRFELLGPKSEILDSEDFIEHTQAVLRPGEKGYYSNYSRELENLKSMDVKEFRAVFDVRETAEEPADFEITDYNVRQMDEGISAFGKVKNPTKKDEKVQVSVIYYDKDGDVLDVETEVLKDVSAGRTLSFEIASRQDIKHEEKRLKRDDIATYSLIARVVSGKIERKKEEAVSFSILRLEPKEHVILTKEVDEEESPEATKDNIFAQAFSLIWKWMVELS